MRSRALVAGITMAGCIGITLVIPGLGSTADAATPWRGHPNRELISYTVRPGDTLYGLAVRYHAWTRELASLNHLRTTSRLRVGRHLRIPVVIKAHRKPAPTARQLRAARIARAVAVVRARYTFKHATRWRGHPDRILVPYRVPRGQTVYSIAVHYHAWTRELIAVNHLRHLRVGQRIRIPIVVSVMRRAERVALRKAIKRASATPHKRRTAAHHRSAHRRTAHHLTARQMVAAGWRDWRMTRRQIRSLIIRTARRHHVSPALALAIGWQESGWHQPLVSGAGAVGVMQLLPGTTQWMSIYAGRSLNARSTPDNVLAGVLFLKYLSRLAGPHHTTQVIAGYYQGLTAIGKKPKWFNDTKRYVRSVTVIYRRLL
ncbi:MAG: LysM peptidoglycan-binding domain-containing protein [Marmoricola sp.]